MDLSIISFSPKFDNDLLLEVVDFVCPKNIKEDHCFLEFHDVHYDEDGNENTDTRWYGEAENLPNKVRIFITEKSRFPMLLRPNGGTSPGYINNIFIPTFEELLVYLTAHELRHIEQWYNREISPLHEDEETDADLYAIAMLDRWRNRLQNPMRLPHGVL